MYQRIYEWKFIKEDAPEETNISDDELNKSVLNLVELLNKYQIGYDDTFPIKINPFEFTISGDELTNWKKKYKTYDVYGL